MSWGQMVAFARRDGRIELSYHFQLVMRLFSTAFAVVTFYFLGRLVGDAPEVNQYRGQYFGFALIGLIVTTLGFTVMRKASRVLIDEAAVGTLEILLVSNARLAVLVGGAIVIPIALGLIDVGMYLALGSLFADVSYTATSLLLAVPVLALVLGTFVGWGLLAAAFVVLTKRGEPFSGLVIQATNLLAGSIFPVALLPDALSWLTRLIPAFYGLRALRDLLLTDGAGSGVIFDVVALVVWNALLIPIGLLALAKALRISRRYGTLVDF